MSPSIQYVGTFSPYRPEPWPADAPETAVFQRNEAGADSVVALEWYAPTEDSPYNPAEPSGDYFLGVEPDGRISISVLDVGTSPAGLPRRSMFIPGPGSRVYRVKGLPDRGLDAGYNFWRFDFATGAISEPA